MKNINTVFYKTVRWDGSSLYARGEFCRRYQIGERYTFPEDFPAHCWGVGESVSLREAFNQRAEGGGTATQRVFILLGDCEWKDTVCINIDRLRYFKDYDHFRRECFHPITEWRLCSCAFTVIGEIIEHKSGASHPGPLWAWPGNDCQWRVAVSNAQMNSRESEGGNEN